MESQEKAIKLYRHIIALITKESLTDAGTKELQRYLYAWTEIANKANAEGHKFLLPLLFGIIEKLNKSKKNTKGDQETILFYKDEKSLTKTFKRQYESRQTIRNIAKKVLTPEQYKEVYRKRTLNESAEKFGIAPKKWTRD
ncbi:MAG: hypothetical protein GX089_14590 [Fibrobacter sp.]|jgi:hypothetical protein|nr:hypothetical protein [Fibrobacter sp.]